MTMRSNHPMPDEILAWAAGKLVGMPRDDEIEAHLATCAEPCGQYLSISMAAVEKAHEEASSPESSVPGSVARQDVLDVPFIEELLRLKREGEELLDSAPKEWIERLERHPDVSQEMFLASVAERAVWWADERPSEVQSFLPSLRARVLGLSPLGREAPLALIGLAEGIALRSQGDHVAALEAYARAEREIPSRPLSPEYARICVQRGASLRWLGRHDEARPWLQLALQGFERLGLEHGRAKVMWELANLAASAGEARTAIRLSRETARLFDELGDARQARRALHGALFALIGRKKVRAAERLLSCLEDQSRDGGPFEHGLLLWKRGLIAILKRDLPACVTALEEAASRFSDAGSPLAAAQVMLDLADAGGQLADLALQARAAGIAASLLSKIPGHAADLAVAVERLRQAVEAGVGVGELVSRLRDRLRAI